MSDHPDTSRCSGCGALLARMEGPVHAYMLSSPACWAGYGAVLAAEYGDQTLWSVHRLSVDAYAVQHPGDGSRRAVRSVGLHLARLMTQLEDDPPSDRLNALMIEYSSRQDSLPALPLPDRFRVTVADVAAHAGTPAHADAVRDWAENCWQDWSTAHDLIRRWAKGG